MAGGNGTLAGVSAFPLYIPGPLRVILKRYQINREMASLNQAIIELLETHPRVAEIVAEVYAMTSQERGTDP